MFKSHSLRTFTLLFLFVCSSFSIAAKYKGKLELLTADELLSKRHNYLVLDTRSAEEFNDGHIKGAINIPHDEVASNIAKLKGLDKTIVVHCRSGRRALVAEQALLDNGFTKLKHLEGDMKGWVADNLPIESNEH